MDSEIGFFNVLIGFGLMVEIGFNKTIGYRIGFWILVFLMLYQKVFSCFLL